MKMMVTTSCQLLAMLMIMRTAPTMDKTPAMMKPRIGGSGDMTCLVVPGGRSVTSILGIPISHHCKADMREPGPRVPHLGTGSVAARVGFEPTEVALGRFQGGCTRPLCDLANRARPGGPILAIIHRAYSSSRT